MVAGAYTMDMPAAIIYAPVVSRDLVHIALTIAVLNRLKLLSCDIQNTFLTVKCHEKIWTRAGPEFGSEAGQIVFVVRELCELK